MPGIYAFLSDLKQDLDGRDKPGHDDSVDALRQIARRI
jgi:hypothetical protein